ncbi:hypothetical protein HMPREF3002_08485 [Streptococcus sp. HMSC065E03]|uniref:DUF1642 domain-containing protein n=1 Tax=Streptococcus sp. HMSC065E03 TaxID=1739505 RepID=UPI0008A29B2B|nr:DUF1642 domain-containing protein [Streptococcus sp. HMSC065E03]OFP06643.1 hypothetical protein HMPREF3002_08485 [Streptococcus sp. HMSC065E03]
MNKQELIESIGHLPSDCSRPRPMIDKLTTLELIKLLDETQEVELPMLVADFITEQKKLSHTLSYSIDACMSDGVAEWYWDNSELFVRAWLDGYTVDKEKRYEVILSNGQSLKTVYRQGEDRLDFEKVYGDLERFTRKQLEDAGLAWVFDCPGVKVKEVE